MSGTTPRPKGGCPRTDRAGVWAARVAPTNGKPDARGGASARGGEPAAAARRLVAAALLADEVERRRVGNRHDRHRAGLHRIADDEVDVVGDRSDHVQG